MLARRVSVALLCGGVLACSKPEEKPAPTSTPSVVAAPVTRDQIVQLRWLEGRWRGSEAGGQPFFEGYRFISDSSIRSLTFADSTFTTVNDSSTIALIGTSLISGSTAMAWVVTAIDSQHITFEPLRVATNSFSWTRTGPDTWIATLKWKSETGEAQQRIYEMKRVP